MRPPLALGVLLAAGALAAQEARFEVASLKRNTSGSSSTTMDNRPDGLVMENGTLRNLIFNAYRPQSTELVGAPGWLADRYDLIAKTTGPSTSEQRAAMLRALLAEELQLRTHYEMREQPVFDLVFARRDRSLGAGIIRTDRDCAAAAAARDAGNPEPALVMPLLPRRTARRRAASVPIAASSSPAASRWRGWPGISRHARAA